MGNLAETSTWEANVYQIEQNDPVLAGADGIDNLPHKHLANRTKYLKDKQDSISTEITNARGGKADLAARLAAIETQTLQGDSNYAGPTGKTITHNLGHTNYIVNHIPLEDTGGDLGDVRIVRAANTFTIYNSGGFLGAMRYQLMT